MGRRIITEYGAIMISLSSVSKKYGTVQALSDVSFTVPKGEILGLLGQNGAGKTTTLNIITGYLAPSSGKVTIDGLDVMEHPRETKRRIGYLPEQPPLYDEMSVRDYLFFCCRLKEVAGKAIPTHVEEILSITGLESVYKRRIGNLSKGFRQRVGIAQALCGAPEVLIFDEPTVGLDPKQIVEIRALIRRLGERHTIIFSSHILHEIEALCKQVIILHQGHVAKRTDLADLSGSGKILRLRATIAGSGKALLPALRGLPAVQRVQSLPCDKENITDVMLECKREQQPQAQLFTLLCGLDMPLLRLTPQEDTLEELFLHAIGHGKEGE